MKRILFSVTCFLSLLSASAQISKGEKMIGGELSFSTAKDETGDFFVHTKTTAFTIAPQIGFGLSKNWIVGAGLGYGLQVVKLTNFNNDYQKQTVSVASVGVFARKFQPFNDKIGIYGQLDVGAGFGKEKQTVTQGSSSFTIEGNVNNITAMVKPGFYFKVAKRIVLEANFGGLGYTTTTYKPEDGEKESKSELSFTLTSTIGLGFQLIF
jgi:hypothetical protein